MRKDFMFRNYWWMASGVAAIAILIIVGLNVPERAGLIGTTIAAALGFCYFAQQQKLSELTLFKSLFIEFNDRYGEINDSLENICASNRNIDSTQKRTLVTYFNLCAEEYLFFKEGFIHKDAWRSWCLGMLYYLGNEQIWKIWEEEVCQDSYYGLTKEVIEAGTRLPRSAGQE